MIKEGKNVPQMSPKSESDESSDADEEANLKQMKKKIEEIESQYGVPD
jgi:hypothetical protein